MADATGVPQEMRNALENALQQAAQGQWPAAIASIRPYADEGHPVAIAVAAYCFGQSGQPAQGIDYAEKAVRGNIAAGPIAANYGSWTSNDASLRSRSVGFWKAALDAGWTIDPIAQAQQLAQ